VGDPQQRFSRRHKYMRKDIERAFGALVAQFQCLKHSFLNWDLDDIKDLLLCCIILCNMMIKYWREKFIFNDLKECKRMYLPGRIGPPLSLAVHMGG